MTKHSSKLGRLIVYKWLLEKKPAASRLEEYEYKNIVRKNKFCQQYLLCCSRYQHGEGGFTISLDFLVWLLSDWNKSVKNNRVRVLLKIAVTVVSSPKGQA